MNAADRIIGCMLGGAVGDALGAAVEFSSLEAIRADFGPEGLRDYAASYGRSNGAVTDDTQMALFTAEGLIRACVGRQGKVSCDPVSVVHHAYLRWLWTQGQHAPLSWEFAQRARWPDGWLAEVRDLRVSRAPGATCLGALAKARVLGAPAANDSKGCGTVMRVAPVGLVTDPSRAFGLGAETSHLTHGNPTGYLAGGYVALLVALVMEGRLSLQVAAIEALGALPCGSEADEVRGAVHAALNLARSGMPAGPELVETLGAGWTAEEAVAIALYSALAGKDFRDSVLLAVNHSGDSDSTGALAGNLRGALDGVGAIPRDWIARLELRDTIETIAWDLVAIAAGTFDDSQAGGRYPGW